MFFFFFSIGINNASFFKCVEISNFAGGKILCTTNILSESFYFTLMCKNLGFIAPTLMQPGTVASTFPLISVNVYPLFCPLANFFSYSCSNSTHTHTHITKKQKRDQRKNKKHKFPFLSLMRINEGFQWKE